MTTAIAETRPSEIIDASGKGFDTAGDKAILKKIIGNQGHATDAVANASEQISAAAEAMAQRLRDPQSRIIYVGAGNSGRVGALDGMELTATFGIDHKRIGIVLADNAELKAGASMDGNEDKPELAIQKLSNLQPPLNNKDVVIAIAASGTTPFTIAAAKYAHEQGALVVGMVNNPKAPLLEWANDKIILNTGPEPIAGSTRMGAGVAQNNTLKALSTLTMMKLGHVFDNLMVDMQISCQKLVGRAIGMVKEITHCPHEQAAEAIEACRAAGITSPIKPAVMMVLEGCNVATAEAHLNAVPDRNLRSAILNLPVSQQPKLAVNNARLAGKTAEPPVYKGAELNGLR